jgi:hypothetical protein
MIKTCLYWWIVKCVMPIEVAERQSVIGITARTARFAEGSIESPVIYNFNGKSCIVLTCLKTKYAYHCRRKQFDGR